MELLAENYKDYQLLDSGNGDKLEIIAGVKCVRPCPQAIWPKRLSDAEWKKATSVCIRQKDGGGHWKHKGNEPTGLTFTYKTPGDEDLPFLLKFTSFGHTGIFFEQSPVWKTLYNAGKSIKGDIKRPLKFLNLFGYTGAASLVMARLGFDVVHVDSAKGVLNWGRDNQKSCKLMDKRVSFVQQDVMEYLRYAKRKGVKFDGILADPPSWGHGVKKGETWVFENQISELVELCRDVMAMENSFFLLSCHTHGVQNEALKNILRANFYHATVDSGEIGVKHKNDERILPAGIFGLATNICR